MTRVVITGTGICTGAGIGLENHAHALHSGSSKFELLSEIAVNLPFSLEGLYKTIGTVTVCAVHHSNEVLAQMSESTARKFDRHQLFAFIAAQEAMKDVNDFNAERFACIGATGGAGLLDIFSSSQRLIEGKKLFPSANLKYLPNLFVGYLTQRFGIKGPSHVHGTACAASMHAITDLVRMIKLDEVDGGLVVGAEAAISAFGIASFQAQRALGNGLAFNTNRTGFVMGEGAGAVVIESLESAEKHAANILAEIIGYGESSDGVLDGQITDPSPDGAAKAARKALEVAGCSMAEISLVKSHGTATGQGDVSELKSLQINASAETLEKLPVISVKSHIGHLLGAAGVAEIVVAVDMMKRGVIYPTRGLTGESSIDSECSFVDHVTKVRENENLEKVLCNGFGFGGTNSSIILSRTP